jgi:hypothetical protein
VREGGRESEMRLGASKEEGEEGRGGKEAKAI